MLILWSPSAESILVEHVVADDIHVNVYGSYILVTAFEVQTDKLALVCALVVDAIYKVAATLYHALVYQFLEWFVLATVA